MKLLTNGKLKKSKYDNSDMYMNEIYGKKKYNRFNLDLKLICNSSID